MTVVRDLSVFGYHEPEGHGEVHFKDVRVPRATSSPARGWGFAIAQARLGPGRIHHCMRSIGAAERALELMCERADRARGVRQAGLPSTRNIRDWIAEAGSSSRWRGCSC